MKNAEAQKDLFNCLIQKSKYYGKPIDFSKVILVANLDKILDELAKTFGFKIFWDDRHLNQTICNNLKDKQCLQIVLQYIKNIKTCESKSKAEEEVNKLKEILTAKFIKMNNSMTVNPFYDEKVWEYLSKNIFKDLDKIGKWTIAHLNSEFWF